MSILDQVIEGKLKDLGDDGIARLRALLDGKADEATVGWQKGIYTLVSTSVGLYGPTGVNKALDALHSLVNGEAVNLDWANLDLEVSSDILARMENVEADARTATHAFIIQVGEVVKEIVGVVLTVI